MNSQGLLATKMDLTELSKRKYCMLRIDLTKVVYLKNDFTICEFDNSNMLVGLG